MNPLTRFAPPLESGEDLAGTQRSLMKLLELHLGPRDERFTILPPRIAAEGPFIEVWPDQFTARAVLSPGAGRHVFTAIFELAHESVHLLNPKVGGTNNFEEGIAATFSRVVVSEFFELQAPYPVAANGYGLAHAAVASLSVGALEAGRLARLLDGALIRATPATILQLSPSTTEATAAWLTAPFGNGVAP